MEGLLQTLAGDLVSFRSKSAVADGVFLISASKIIS